MGRALAQRDGAAGLSSACIAAPCPAGARSPCPRPRRLIQHRSFLAGARPSPGWERFWPARAGRDPPARLGTGTHGVSHGRCLHAGAQCHGLDQFPHARHAGQLRHPAFMAGLARPRFAPGPAICRLRAGHPFRKCRCKPVPRASTRCGSTAQSSRGGIRIRTAHSSAPGCQSLRTCRTI